MEVTDIREVPGDKWGSGDTPGGADGKGAGREPDTGMVGRRARAERDASTEPSGDRVSVCDATRGEHGACELHRKASGGADWRRGDDMGVGYVCEVLDDAWGPGDTTGGADGWGAGRQERDSGMVGRRARAERDTWTEPSGNRICVGDGTRGEHGA